MERLFGCDGADGRSVQPALKKGDDHRLVLIRYADDFVVIAPSRETLERYVLPKIQAFLGDRGLELNWEKTRIVPIDEGINFLGFGIRKFRDGKLLIMPEKAKVLAHLGRVKAYLDQNKQAPAGKVVRDLAPVIRGWTAYYRHACSARTFQYADYRVWQMLWSWGRRRHRDKGTGWVKARYFRATRTREWNFTDATRPGAIMLPRYSDTKISRHTKVRGRLSPLDPEARDYWARRRADRLEAAIYSKRRRELLRLQGYACAECGIAFDPDADPWLMDEHHARPRHLGGGNETENLRLVHRWCHHQHHQRCGYKAAEA